METLREQGQSQASAEALAVLTQAWSVTADAKSQEVRQLERQLREARKALKIAWEAENAADAAYIATPYAEGS